MWQVFAVNDQTTARYMSERLGEHIVWRKQRTFNQETQKYEEEWMPQGASFLRTGIELGREVSRDSGNQVIFVEGGDSFLLRRRPYDKTFKKSQYSPDPSEPQDWPGWKSLVESLQDKAVSHVEEWLARKAGKQTAPAQAPAPVAQPVVKADVRAMSPEEMEAEREKIVAEIKSDPRIQNYFNFTPEEKEKWFADHQHHHERVHDIDEELAARLAREQAVSA